MDPFPFTPEDWEKLAEAALVSINATLAEDSVLNASALVQVQEVLTGLRAKYGEHPVLLETEADFCEDPPSRLALYERAKEIAVAHALPTLSIRVEIAALLLHDFGRPAGARAELLACKDEVPAEQDELTKERWESLMTECDRVLSSRHDLNG